MYWAFITSEVLVNWRGPILGVKIFLSHRQRVLSQNLAGVWSGALCISKTWVGESVPGRGIHPRVNPSWALGVRTACPHAGHQEETQAGHEL